MVRVLVAVLLLLCASAAHAEKPEVQCTREYVRELEHDLEANTEVRKKFIGPLRAACKVIDKGEGVVGDVLKWFGIDEFAKKIILEMDPKVLSNTCRYIRKRGQDILSPDKEEERIKAELVRCQGQKK